MSASMAVHHALVLDGEASTLAPVALRLVRMGIAVHYACWIDEGRLLVEQEAGRIRAVVVPPEVAPAPAGRLLEQARAQAPESSVALVPVGRKPPEEVRESLRRTGASWAVWEPFDDGDLRFVLNTAMALPSELAPRKEPRAPVSLICWLQVGGTRVFGVLSSLSSRGAFIEMAEPLPIGTEVGLKFGLGKTSIEADARIIYHNGSDERRALNLPLGAGLLFTQIDAGDQERIREFVKHRAERFTV